MPRNQSDLITLRMKRPMEWLPNGRTTLWFSAGTGRLVAVRDAETLNRTTRAYNALYPLHAAKIGELAFRLITTASGLALALLGTLAVWTFWFKQPKKRPVIHKA